MGDHERREEEKRRPEDCLVVAADFKPDKGGKQGVKMQVITLATHLKGTGVCIKLNSILRACGTELAAELAQLGLKVGMDYKLHDIPETMEIDAMLIAPYRPEFVTVMCAASVEGMSRVKKNLLNTEVLGVTVLTSLDDEECQNVHICTPAAGVLRFARLAKLAKIDGLILSPRELPVIARRNEFADFSLNTPGIRLEGKEVPADDQKRVGTPYDAIKNGARRIIIGRPITQAPDPKEAVKQILEEIQRAQEALEASKKK